MTKSLPILACGWRLPLQRSQKPLFSSLIVKQHDYHNIAHKREASTAISLPASRSNVDRLATGLQRLPLSTLLRNLFLGVLFQSPTILRLGVATLDKIANSRSIISSPERNPIVRSLIKKAVYDQFCAGTNENEVSQTRKLIKSMGYSGIILCYGKEIQISKNNELHSTGSGSIDRAAEINMWRDGNLQTLDMVGQGDWLGIKLTGAGHGVTEALMQGQDPPEQFLDAMYAICDKAAAQQCRLWIDAEQQVLQTQIDRWTIDLMRRYNRDGKALVYNTLQAYLKAARTKLQDHLALAAREDWTLAIKLVRGAYIANDQREKIHDTKNDTDESYNGIVHDLLTGKIVPEQAKVQLFLAGHNPQSISQAFDLIQQLSERDQLRVRPDFGQLQGMADHVSCKLLNDCDQVLKQRNDGTLPATVTTPHVYKCLTWGSLQECLQYLLRRIIENSSGADRMRDGISLYYAELRRRIFAR